MLGRDIEIVQPGRKPKAPKIFYVNELSYGITNNNVRPPTVPIVGMDRIRARNWMAYFIDYATSSSVHGVNHLAAPNRHWLERILTVIFIISSVIGFIFLSLYFWNKYQYNATIIVLDHDYRHFTIDQPAVVMCPKNGVDEAKFPDVFKRYGVEDTEEMRSFFTTISRKSHGYNGTLPKMVNVDSAKWLSILNDLKPEIIYVSSQIQSLATWIVTEYGFCQAIYNDAAIYSSYDYWKDDNWTVLDESENERTCEYLSPACSMSFEIQFQGLLFTIGKSDDVFDLSKNLYDVALNHAASLTLNVKAITSSEELRELSPQQKHCKFHEENHLTMWPIYTFAMCKSECMCKKIFEICGCHPHFVRPTRGIPTCNLTQLTCIDKNILKIEKYDFERMRECGCISDCDHTYYLEDDYSEFFVRSTTPGQSSFTIDLKFPTDKWRREEVFGFIDFLAAAGGSAGLLLGASILSFVEFFYFGTLRCFLYYRKIKRRNE